MTYQLNPYLGFAGDARQAMEFYRDVLGGSLSIMTFGEAGADHGDPRLTDRIMHSSLETAHGLTLMGADMMPDQEYNPGTAFSVCLNGDSQDELRTCWSHLSDGGTVTTPLEKQFWGDEFGMCVDRFGVSWMVNISQPPSS